MVVLLLLLHQLLLPRRGRKSKEAGESVVGVACMIE